MADRDTGHESTCGTVDHDYEMRQGQIFEQMVNNVSEMESTSSFITAVGPVDSEPTNESTIQDLLRCALLEYDAQKQNRSLRFQWLEPHMAQQLVDHLQSILDSEQDSSEDYEKYFGLLRHLSRRFQILPLSLVIRDIRREGQNPVAGGGFADIWRGTLNEKHVCLKVLRLTLEQDETARNKIREQFCHEALVWRQLHHPNILPLLGVNIDLFHPSFCLISPWMENRDIITLLKKGNLQHSLPSILREIAAGLHYLHTRDPPLIHGDIRGGNILVKNDLHCCLADFGLTLVTTNSQVWSTTKGSMRWLAPEYVSSSGPNHTSRDVYAFGCTIVEILTQKLPFHDCKTDYNVMFQVMNGGRPTRPQDVWCPDDIWDLTTRCWAQTVEDRPSSYEIHDILQSVHGTRTAAFGDNDEDDGEEVVMAAPGPDATELEKIEYKRRQNSIAARRSRRRKLEYTRVLQLRVDELKMELEQWKTRAETLQEILRSHSIDFRFDGDEGV
ncbi:hypothetical protein GYMLUDRAFT_48095, partial [Collybiopsis luxurians FD-317 M1]